MSSCIVMSIVGKSVIIDAMDAELAPKISEAIIKDNERARKARDKRKKRKKRRDRRSDDR